MRNLLILFTLIGCNVNNKPAIDAAPPDVAEAALDCPTYCTEIQANCTGANAQYTDMAHCLSMCASFIVGASKVTDTSGNTLGCRIYYAGAPSMTTPATHCAHAGPEGDLITATAPAFCSGGDVCASFCTIEIKACGSLETPLPGNPRDNTNNPLFQYQNIADCMDSCDSSFDKTYAYSTMSAGASLACRLVHAISAAIAVTPNGANECASTAAAPTGPCAGTATP